MAKVVWTAALVMSIGLVTASAQTPQTPPTQSAQMQTRRDRIRARIDKRIQTRIQRIDRNGDGAVSRDEWPGAAKRFDRLDANHDGVLTKDELTRGAAKRLKARRDARRAAAGA